MINLWGLKRKIVGVLRPKSLNEGISFFDVKELHNLAYEQRANARCAIKEFKKTQAQARAMDAAYRSQLGMTSRRAA